MLCCIPMLINAQYKIMFTIGELPQYHSQDNKLFLAGSFNGWNPHDSDFHFKKDENGKYVLSFQLKAGTYEYKITRGSWDMVECKKNGTGATNRLLTVNGDVTETLDIEEWQDRFPAKQRLSTASKNVKIIDTAFLIPQLKRARRIWIYLPENYDAQPTYKWPVLYMHDGQNIFDDATSYAGEWGVDEFLDSAKAKSCIVVAIDNGGDKRLNEYCPYDFELKGIAANNKTNIGEGNLYVDFLVKTLKPFIDKNYRTLANKSNTFIAGSSMGGLISLYAVLKYPEVFGGVGVFSPAFWVSGDNIFKDIQAKGKKVNSKIYFYGGGAEGPTMVPDMQKAYNEMKKVSKSKMKIVVNKKGMHNEPTWRKEFPAFYFWMMYK